MKKPILIPFKQQNHFFKSLAYLTLLGILFALAMCKEPTESNALTFLKAQGTNIVNESGEKVMLQSVGLGNWLLPEGYMWRFGGNADRPRRIEKLVSDLIGEEQADQFWKTFRENYITETDIQRMKQLGFNAVRVALNSRLFITEDKNPEFIDEGFMHLENLVTWCKNNNMYVIIDMHGAPGGQTGQNIDDSPNDLPELFMDQKNEDALIKHWLEIAKRYKDEPTIAAYDLLNEPLPERTGAAAKHKDQLIPLYKKLTREIRKIDSRHMITIEGYDWSNNWSVFGEAFDDNLLYQFHYYCWNKPDNLNNIDYFLKYRDTLNAPVWVGETGEKDNAIYWATTQYFEENNISWSFWPWKKMDTKNTPYSIPKPANWDLITDYSHGGEKPDSATAQAVFNELLSLIKLENCDYYQDVAHSIFRRIPGKIEAENYAYGVYGKSWYVADTAKKASYYRTAEFVPIELITLDSTSHFSHRNSEQCIVLKTGEFTSYQMFSEESAVYRVSVRVKTTALPAKIAISYGQNAEEVELDNQQWSTIDVTAIPCQEGENSITFRVVDGSVSLDWMQLETL